MVMKGCKRIMHKRITSSFLSYHHLSFRALCKGASSKSAAEEVAVVEDDGADSGIVREFCLMRLGHDPAPHC